MSENGTFFGIGPLWTSGLCEANGITIHCLRTGGDKPPLIPLHGLTGSGEAVNFSERVPQQHCPVSDEALKRSTHFREEIA
jgi:pimeloyl-ACP methyl ester carboxylesterase